MFRHPRWEDYEYEMRDELKGNALAWFGNGLSQRQIVMKGTTEEYLDQEPVPVEFPFPLPLPIAQGHAQVTTNGVDTVHVHATNGVDGEKNGLSA